MFRFFSFLPVLLALGCGTGVIDRTGDVSTYAARASWQWETTDHFLLRGRARLEGGNQVFSGPLMLWASKEVSSVRADFCGPDGSPLISLLLDSAGCLVYQPGEAAAFYVLGGIPAGDAYLDVNAVISLIRTGYPGIPVQWEIAESCDTTSSDNSWYFTSSFQDTAVVSLKQASLFPFLKAGDFSLEVTATSWHDQFNAWPMEWRLGSPSVNAVIRLRSYDTETEPAGSVWNLMVPVPIDTVWIEGGPWLPAFELPVR
jgi:hypothetical protein